jgi:hypothetical protein
MAQAARPKKSAASSGWKVFNPRYGIHRPRWWLRVDGPVESLLSRTQAGGGHTRLRWGRNSLPAPLAFLA